MDIDYSRIQLLIERPSESLNVEVKTWIDPDKLEGQSKILKTALALRNRNGGYLVIGFNKPFFRFIKPLLTACGLIYVCP